MPRRDRQTHRRSQRPSRTRPSPLTLAVVVLGAGLVGAGVWFAATRTGSSGATAVTPAPPASLLLVTIDTLRADRVGAYGWASARTPALDGLAARGARFDRAFANAPVTLPSHASLLTGLLPPGHGARHNGMRVAPGVATLAEMLRAQGFRTAAFVAAFPLDRRFGLDRGFELYSDQLPRESDGRLNNERPGRVVVDEAIAWLNDRRAERCFLWVHLFEPHAPYEGDPARETPGFVRPVGDRYDDEVARADVEVGRLLASLGEGGSSSLVVVAGDHGEAFGEHGEIAHSVFVYDTTLRVPLIMAGPGVPGSGVVVSEPVSLVDVLPTVVELLGQPPNDVDGTSLVPTLVGRTLGRRELYAESFAPLLDFGWSSLRSVRVGSEKYIAAPKPELYDLARDPDETRNVLEDRRDAGRTLAERVDRYAGAELPAVDQPASASDTRARLTALGYLSGRQATAPPTGRPDPKDRKALAARIAQVTSGELAGAALEAALEAIVRDDPANGQGHLRLGYVLLEKGDCRGAEPHFRDAIAARVPSADPYLGLAECLGARDDGPGAVQALLEARRVEPGNPVVEANLGVLALAEDRLDDAIVSLRKALEIAPDLHEARFTLARAYLRAGLGDEAAREARELLARLPEAAPQRPEVERLLRAVQ